MGPEEGNPPQSAPLEVRSGNRFARDIERMSKRGKDIEKLRAIAKELASRNPLPARFRDHPLKGDWVGFRECHVEPDWLLVYRREGATLILQRTGTHTDLFG